MAKNLSLIGQSACVLLCAGGLQAYIPESPATQPTVKPAQSRAQAPKDQKVPELLQVQLKEPSQESRGKPVEQAGIGVKSPEQPVKQVSKSKSAIIEISEFESIIPYLTPDTQETWVATDIDDTVLRGCDKKATDQEFGRAMSEYMAAGLSVDEAVRKVLAWHVAAHLKTVVYPTDEDVARVIDLLQQNKIRCFALTARGKLENITRRQFGDVNVDLKPNNWEKRLVIKVPGAKNDAYYVPGIIFCNGNDKGKVLKQFSAMIGESPKRLIFIDDLMKNLKAVLTAAVEMGIPEVFGLHIVRTHLDRHTCTKETIPAFAVTSHKKLRPRTSPAVQPRRRSPQSRKHPQSS